MVRNDKLNTKQFFIYHFYDFKFFTDLDNTFTRSRALGWLFDPALQLYSKDDRRLTPTDWYQKSWKMILKIRNTSKIVTLRTSATPNLMEYIYRYWNCEIWVTEI